MSAQKSVQELIGERVRSIPEYVPESLEEIAVRLGLPVGQLIKLDANENPYGPTKRALHVLNGYTSYHHYPDAVSRRVRRAIAEYLSVDPERVLVGNGSDELIDLILRLFRPGRNKTAKEEQEGISQVITCPPTFDMYRFYSTTNDLDVTEFPRDASFRVNVAGIEALCRRDPRPRLLFLASPNNPDGGLLTEAELVRLLALPLIIVLDQAYIEFSSTGSFAHLVAQRGNLIVLRSFSKWAGLAGLRVGYGIFPKWMMSPLWRLKSPFNVNCAAQAAAVATLEDVAEARAGVAKIVAERQRLLDKLREFPFLRVLDSQANYLLCKVDPHPGATTVQDVRRTMEAHGIILRYYSSPALQQYFRITVGTPMQDEAAIVALRSLL